MGNAIDHEKNLRPGKSHAPVNHPRETPKTAVKQATPITSRQVLVRSSGRSVLERCSQISLSGVRNELKIVARGISRRQIMWNIPEKSRLDKIPRLYETEHIPTHDKLIYLNFFIGGSDWYVVEFDGDDIFLVMCF